MKILVVDDDPRLRELVSISLERAGYQVVTARDGQMALTHALREMPDMVVLDVGLPEIDGLEVCRRLRARSEVPILFLTARDDEIDRILGLELGADDYVTKPFSPRELVARIKAILKRSGNGRTVSVLRHGPVELDVSGHSAKVDGAVLMLTATELSILRRLMQTPEAIVSRPQLIDAIYGAGSAVADRTLDSHLRNLRRKLGERGGVQRYRDSPWDRATDGFMAELTRKWRPSLGFVLSGGLAGTLALSLMGLIALRYLGPEIGFRNAAGLLAILIVCATGVLGYLLIRLLLRPISVLAIYSESVEQGNEADRPEHFGTQELSRLAGSVLGMANTLQRREASIRSFADHVTHELKTPVTAIRAAGELLSEADTLSDQDRILLQQILGASDQMQTQLSALNRVAAARIPDHHGECRLGDLIDEMQASFPDLSLSIRGEKQSMPLAASGLKVVLQQLLENARRHGAGRVTLSAAPGLLSVQDDGPGVSEGNRDRIFDPFFTTTREHGGTGMGLTIAANLLAAHGAGISLAQSSAGARFEIDFPTA